MERSEVKQLEEDRGETASHLHVCERFLHKVKDYLCPSGLTRPGARDFNCINGKFRETASQLFNKKNSEPLDEMMPGRKFQLQEGFQIRLSSMDEVELTTSENEDTVGSLSITKLL